MSILYFPLQCVLDYPNYSIKPRYLDNLRPDLYSGKSPSECCGALYNGGTNTGENKGIVMWYSDKPEDENENDYYIESIKLVNSRYLHIKHNLSEECQEQEYEESEYEE